MCKLTPREETILVNIRSKERGLAASQLGITTETLEVHLTRIRKKRAECQAFLRKTDQYKRELYPKRKGE